MPATEASPHTLVTADLLEASTKLAEPVWWLLLLVRVLLELLCAFPEGAGPQLRGRLLSHATIIRRYGSEGTSKHA